jgi:Flp pilus assembly protein TadG
MLSDPKPSPTERLSRRAAGLARRFCRARSGVSAVEFALLAPVLVTMLGGAVEMSGAITAANRSTYVADSLAEMVSRVDHTITATEMKNFAVAASLVDPDIVRYAKESGKDLEKSFKVTVTSVQFDKKVASCQSGCSYDAKTVFSYSLNGVARSCGKLAPATGESSSPDGLPADVYGPGSLVMVEVETFYMPVMPIRLSETISFKRSSYFRPRYLSRINYEKNCPGY